MLGSWLTYLVHSDFMRPVVLVLLVGVLGFTLWKPDLGHLHAPRFGLAHQRLLSCIIALVLGLLHPTMRPERTRASILKHAAGLIGIGLALAWLMYLLPRHPVRF